MSSTDSAGEKRLPHSRRPKLSRQSLSIGIAATVVVHILLGVLLIKGMVGDHALEDKRPRKIPVSIQLPPPPPPAPPPPPPKLPPPPPPPKEIPPPQPTNIPPPPAPEIVADVPAEKSEPTVAAAPPAPPAPAVPRVATSVSADYYRRIQAALAKNVRYPPKAAQDGQQGECQVSISFDRSGRITGSQLVKKTGFPALDRACLEAVSLTGSFPPVSAAEAPGVQFFAVTLPVNFKLDDE